MKWTSLPLLIACASFVSGCLPATDEALFRDVAKRPPDAERGTVKAINADEEFAEWVIYMDRACDEFGCVQ